jgi:hypothetical protein
MRVEVVRRGGLAGIPLRGSIDTADLPPAAARAASGVLTASRAASGPPHPDGFQYELSGRGQSVVLNEREISDDLRPLIDAALAHGTLG